MTSTLSLLPNPSSIFQYLSIHVIYWASLVYLIRNLTDFILGVFMVINSTPIFVCNRRSIHLVLSVLIIISSVTFSSYTKLPLTSCYTSWILLWNYRKYFNHSLLIIRSLVFLLSEPFVWTHVPVFIYVRDLYPLMKLFVRSSGEPPF